MQNNNTLQKSNNTYYRTAYIVIIVLLVIVISMMITFAVMHSNDKKRIDMYKSRIEKRNQENEELVTYGRYFCSNLEINMSYYVGDILKYAQRVELIGVMMHDRDQYMSIMREGILNINNIKQEIQNYNISSEYTVYKDDLIEASNACKNCLQYIYNVMEQRDLSQNNVFNEEILSKANYASKCIETCKEDMRNISMNNIKYK